MNEPNPELLRKEGWGSCPNPSCGYFFFKKQALSHCPACRADWRSGPVYNQPPWESPGLQ